MIIDPVTGTRHRFLPAHATRYPMKNKMMPIEFPENIDEMLDNWASCPDENIGWCLLCDGPIRSAQDLIGIGQGFGTRINPTGGPRRAL